MLGHDESGATGFAGMNIDLIHEGLHQKHASSGIAEDILVISRIGYVFDAKSGALIHYMDHQLVFMQLEGQVDFSLAALLVAVLKGIHDPFVHRQADPVLILLAKSGNGGNTHTYFFGKSDALD
jgi:hypothetical protein